MRNDDLDQVGINPDEKEQILEEINRLVSSSKIHYDPKKDKVNPKHKGFLFPLVWNILVVLIITGGIFGARAFFGAREENQIASSRNRSLDANSATQALLRQKQEELEAKDAELQEINARLSSIALENQGLEESFETRLEEQQALLRDQLERELSAERARLQTQGASQEEIQAQLAALEQERSQAIALEMSRLREEAQKELEAQQRALAETRARLEAELVAQQNLRNSLAQETQEEAARMEQALSRQSQELASLQQERESVLLFENQLGSLIQNLQNRLESQDYEGTLSTIGNLEALIETALSSPNPAIIRIGQRQQSLVTGLKSTLQQLLSQEGGGPDPRLVQFTQLYREAQNQSTLEGREQRLRAAFALIPELSEAYEALAEIEESGQLARLQTLSQEFNALGSSGRPREAIGALVQGLLRQQASTPAGQEILQNLNNQLALLQDRVESPLPAQQEALNNARNRITTLEGELGSLQVRLETQIQEANAREQELQGRIQDLQANSELPPNEGDQELLAENQSLLEQLAQLTGDKQKLEEEKRDNQERLAQLDERLITLDSEKQGLERQLSQLSETGDESQDQGILTLENRIEELEGKEQELLAQQEALEGELGRLQEENRLLLEELAQLPGEESAFSEEISRLQQLLSERDEALAQLRSLEQQTQRVLSLFQGAQSSINSALANPTTRNLGEAKARLSAIFQGSEAQALYPSLGKALEDLFQAQPSDVEIDPTPFKRAAYQEALAFTQYLLGEVAQASQIKAQSEEISRREEAFASLVENIQKLSERGALEEPADTRAYQLYGTIVITSGNKITAEQLTALNPEIGQRAQIRSTGLLGGDTLAAATVVEVQDRRIVLEIESTTPGMRGAIFGDALYLALP